MRSHKMDTRLIYTCVCLYTKVPQQQKKHLLINTMVVQKYNTLNNNNKKNVIFYDFCW